VASYWIDEEKKNGNGTRVSARVENETERENLAGRGRQALIRESEY